MSKVSNTLAQPSARKSICWLYSPSDRWQGIGGYRCLAPIAIVQDPEIWHQCLTHFKVQPGEQPGEGVGHQQRWFIAFKKDVKYI